MRMKRKTVIVDWDGIGARGVWAVEMSDERG